MMLAVMTVAVKVDVAAAAHIGPEPANSQSKPLDGRIILQLRQIWFGMI